jgi:hypothetical protein
VAPFIRRLFIRVLSCREPTGQAPKGCAEDSESRSGKTLGALSRGWTLDKLEPVRLEIFAFRTLILKKARLVSSSPGGRGRGGWQRFIEFSAEYAEA